MNEHQSNNTMMCDIPVEMVKYGTHNMWINMRHMDVQNLHTMLVVDQDEKGQQKKGMLRWFKEAFNTVNCDALDTALANKSQIHKHWLMIQSLGLCRFRLRNIRETSQGSQD